MGSVHRNIFEEEWCICFRQFRRNSGVFYDCEKLDILEITKLCLFFTQCVTDIPDDVCRVYPMCEMQLRLLMLCLKKGATCWCCFV